MVLSAHFTHIPAGRSFIVESHRGGKWGYNVHAHPCYELMIIRGGAANLVVGDYQDHFHAGELFLLAPGLPHCFSSDGFLPNGMLLEALALSFTSDLVDTQRIPELAALAPMLTRSRRGLRFRGPVVDEVADRLLEIHGGEPNAHAISLVCRALDRLAREDSAEQLAEHETSSRFRSEEIARLDAVRSIIRRRFREPLSLEEVARDAGMSASTLNHLLHKFAQTTFLRFLAQVRLDEASRLLTDTDHDITEIAFAAGFGSLSTFNRRFRTHFKKTPQEHRAGDTGQPGAPPG